ncbi:unnamed protein product [Closterium sp. NIES-64]|nr:unnamed protein product [Closterium sp. NIES-64]
MSWRGYQNSVNGSGSGGGGGWNGSAIPPPSFNPSAPPANTSAPVCYSFLSPAGCRFGHRCRFSHSAPPQSLPAFPPTHSAFPPSHSAPPQCTSAFPPTHSALPHSLSAFPPSHSALPQPPFAFLPNHSALPQSTSAFPPSHSAPLPSPFLGSTAEQEGEEGAEEGGEVEDGTEGEEGKADSVYGEKEKQGGGGEEDEGEKEGEEGGGEEGEEEREEEKGLKAVGVLAGAGEKGKGSTGDGGGRVGEESGEVGLGAEGRRRGSGSGAGGVSQGRRREKRVKQGGVQAGIQAVPQGHRQTHMQACMQRETQTLMQAHMVTHMLTRKLAHIRTHIGGRIERGKQVQGARVLHWSQRRHGIVKEIKQHSPDLICLQEVDNHADLCGALNKLGYDSIFQCRTGGNKDGCANFWNTKRWVPPHVCPMPGVSHPTCVPCQVCPTPRVFHARWSCVDFQSIEFAAVGLRDNVALLTVLKFIGENKEGEGVEELEEGEERDEENSSCLVLASIHVLFNPKRGDITPLICLVLANIHVLFNPKRGDIKLAQMSRLLSAAHQLSEKHGSCPVVVCGDFNATPAVSMYGRSQRKSMGVSTSQWKSRSATDVPAPVCRPSAVREAWQLPGCGVRGFQRHPCGEYVW